MCVCVRVCVCEPSWNTDVKPFGGLSEQGGNPVSIAGCPTKTAMPRLIRSLINSAYLHHLSDSESLFDPLLLRFLFVAVASCSVSML